MRELNKGKLMKCGHIANAFVDHDGTHVYCCPICVGTLEAFEPIDEVPNLEGRKAKCWSCDKVVESSFKLPMFEYRPHEEYDKYYCGDYGWE